MLAGTTELDASGVQPADIPAPMVLGGRPATPEETAELVSHYYEDNEAYCKRFFPKTCRTKSAPFHHRIDRALWSGRRQVAIKVFRDGAKTARVRIFISKRIAYGVSRTILYISKSQGKAESTIKWLKRLVENQSEWAVFYGLTQGDTWANDQIEIYNTVLNVRITIVAIGIEGQIRGLNFDDYRPDLIVADDIEDERTVNTKEQITKHRELLYGTVMESLASPLDNPEAMIVIIQTPLDIEDAVETAFANAGDDPWTDWLCIEASCFEVDENGNVVSAWPEKFPLEYLLRKKQSYIKMNILSVWLREKEVTVTSKENCAFVADWLQKHDNLPDVQWEELVLWIDPASSERETADFQAVTLTGKLGGQAWLLAYSLTRGQDIEDSVNAFFDTWDLMLTLGKRKANLRFGVETVGYQKQLKRAIEKEMLRRERMAYIEEQKNDKRSKEDVITQAFRPVASMGQYHCLNSQTEFITDFARYPRVKHDDLMESAARALDMLDLTGKEGNIITGGIERSMATPGIVSRNANRLIHAPRLANNPWAQRRDVE